VGNTAVDSGIGLSYRLASLCSLEGRYTTLCRSQLQLPSGTKNLATGLLKRLQIRAQFTDHIDLKFSDQSLTFIHPTVIQYKYKIRELLNPQSFIGLSGSLIQRIILQDKNFTIPGLVDIILSL
jgi:hypothetical protein